ncbi:hypothetical protein [uncultured Piscinibacter sp.]|uniref:hypothetical protein n=1 Tax=uncultured Piscinibacter sp. TaxID=1131835 RepID=UPI002631C4E0|nr:hypothetical protein [uncultured Piscinibacter sp.]
MSSLGRAQYTGFGATANLPWRRGHGADHDGWIGTPELPGYRAGALIVKLADLPGVDALHLYLDILRIGSEGHIDETHSGPCQSLRREQPLDARSRFVRVLAELLRHAPDPEHGLAGLGPALTALRENGIEGPQFALSVQQLDAACSESALVACLCHILLLSLGEEESVQTLDELLQRLMPRARAGGELADQVGLLVRRVGKAQARRRLREATDFDLLPTPELLGL